MEYGSKDQSKSGEYWFERLEARPAIEKARRFFGKTNAGIFFEWPAKTVLCVGIESTRRKDQYGIDAEPPIWCVRYRFVYDMGGWQIPNIGDMYDCDNFEQLGIPKVFHVL